MMKTYAPFGRPSWPSRGKCAEQHRTLYGDEDVAYPDQLSDHATPEEIEEVLTQARKLWADMGRELKALGPLPSKAEWRQMWASKPPGERLSDEVLESDVGKGVHLRSERSDFNRRIIKPLQMGEWPSRGLCGWDERLPLLKKFEERRWAARAAAREAARAERAARPVDDEAWEASGGGGQRARSSWMETGSCTGPVDDYPRGVVRNFQPSPRGTARALAFRYLSRIVRRKGTCLDEVQHRSR
jgi:hypothetical protein